MITYEINKSKLGRKIACILGSENDYMYKNIVKGYIENTPILICTNLSQTQWNDFCEGKLAKKELEKNI